MIGKSLIALSHLTIGNQGINAALGKRRKIGLGVIAGISAVISVSAAR